MYNVLSFSALSLAVKLLVGFLLTKLFAYFLGPSGLATLGNLKNVTQLLSSYGSMGMQSGIIRFSSEFKLHKHKITELLGTLNIIFTVSSIVGGFFVYFFSDELAQTIFQDRSLNFIFKITSVLLPMHGFHLMYYALLQGFGNYKRVVGQDILMNLLKITLAAVMILNYGLTGALLTIVTLPSIYFFLSVFNVSKSLNLFKVNWSTSVAKNLGLYSLMNLFSSIAIPLVYILIRNRITLTLGLENAGYWEAVNQFSFFYFMALQSVILMYVIPRISANLNITFFRKQIKEYFVKLMPGFIVFLLLLFLFRDSIIWLLLTANFNAVSDLMMWQLLGDVFRASSLVLLAYVHARRLIKHYIVVDLVFSISMLLFSYLFIEFFGLIGAVQAHFVSYFLYFSINVFLLRKPLFLSANE